MENIIYSFDEIKRKLLPVFQQYDVKQAILFGSYGKGTATQKSDIDLLVDSGLKGLSFVGLIEAVRKALGEKEIDLFDVSHIEKGSLIDEEIVSTGVKIYEK
jgi:hypothetical protein